MLRPSLFCVPLITLKPGSQPHLLPLCSIWANCMFPQRAMTPAPWKPSS